MPLTNTALPGLLHYSPTQLHLPLTRRFPSLSGNYFPTLDFCMVKIIVSVYITQNAFQHLERLYYFGLTEEDCVDFSFLNAFALEIVIGIKYANIRIQM